MNGELLLLKYYNLVHNTTCTCYLFML